MRLKALYDRIMKDFPFNAPISELRKRTFELTLTQADIERLQADIRQELAHSVHLQTGKKIGPEDKFLQISFFGGIVKIVPGAATILVQTKPDENTNQTP